MQTKKADPKASPKYSHSYFTTIAAFAALLPWELLALLVLIVAEVLP